MTKPQLTQAERQAILARLDAFSRLTDSSIPLPFTQFRVGLEAIVGLLPVVGDLAGLLLSSYVLVEAHRAGAPSSLKWCILINMAIDFFGGLLPIIGDLFDVFFKANTRNARLVREFLENGQ